MPSGRRRSPPTCRACRSARAKFAAYTLSGLLAAIGGLFLTFFTYSGEASLANGSTYTLFSIAAVVLGGVSLFGGVGSAIGAIFGALRLPHHRRPALRLRPRSALAAAVPGRRAAARGLPRRGAALPGPQPAGAVRMRRRDELPTRPASTTQPLPARLPRASTRRSPPPSPASSCCSSSAASIRANSCRRNICCSSSRSPPSSASSPPA